MKLIKSLFALGWVCCSTVALASPDPVADTSYFPTAPKSRPQAIASGPDKTIWFATSTSIFRRTMEGNLSEFKLPDNLTSPVGGTVVQSLVLGPDGNFWGAYNQGNAIWRMTPGGEFTRFDIPTKKAWPRDMVAGPDGNLWFTELEGNKIAKITTSGAFTEYAIPTPKAHPYGMTVGPDGQIWFTEYYTQKIGKVSVKGEFTEYPVPKHGDDGPGGPRCIATGKDGNLWFTEWKANKIGRITPQGEITEFEIPTPRSGSIGIGPGPDGNIWYCANKGKRIGCVTPAGAITEHPLQPDSEPFLLTSGPDGNVWFSDEKDRVGFIKVGSGTGRTLGK